MFAVTVGSKKYLRFFFPFRANGLSVGQRFCLGFDDEVFQKGSSLTNWVNLSALVALTLTHYFVTSSEMQNTIVGFAVLAILLGSLKWIKHYSIVTVTEEMQILVRPTRRASITTGMMALALAMLFFAMTLKNNLFSGFCLLVGLGYVIFGLRNAYYRFKYRDQFFVLREGEQWRHE